MFRQEFALRGKQFQGTDDDSLPAWAKAFIGNLDYGVALLNSVRTLVSANASGTAEYAALVSSGAVHTMAAEFSRAFAGALAGKRSYVKFGQEPTLRIVAFMPLGEYHGNAEPAVALVFERSNQAEPISLTLFAKLYGLTGAETNVLGVVSEGASVSEVAVRLDCAVSTVRTHVRRIFDKTGVTNLRALVSRMGNLPTFGSPCQELSTRYLQ
jgi:DNA-binding CsgD family transcriptional regulator